MPSTKRANRGAPSTPKKYQNSPIKPVGTSSPIRRPTGPPQTVATDTNKCAVSGTLIVELPKFLNSRSGANNNNNHSPEKVTASLQTLSLSSLDGRGSEGLSETLLQLRSDDDGRVQKSPMDRSFEENGVGGTDDCLLDDSLLAGQDDDMPVMLESYEISRDVVKSMGAAAGIESQSSHDADSAIVEDFSSDNTAECESLDGSHASDDGVSNVERSAAVAIREEIKKCADDDESAENTPCRSWFANEFKPQQADWSNEPDVTVLPEDVDCTLPNINGVPLSELSMEVVLNTGPKSPPSLSSSKPRTPRRRKKTKSERSPTKSTPSRTPTKWRDVSDESSTSSTRRRRQSASSSEESTHFPALKSRRSTRKQDRQSPKKSLNIPFNESRAKNADVASWREESSRHDPAVAPPSPTRPLDGVAAHDEERLTQQYLFPDEQCGRLIGKAGKNVQDYKLTTGADIVVELSGVATLEKVVTIMGKRSEIRRVVNIINKRFDGALRRITLLNPPRDMEVIYETLPLELPMDIVVTTIVDAGHFFIQRLIHDDELSMEMLQNDLSGCYFTASHRFVFPVDGPPEVGSFAVVFADGAWYRCRVDDIWWGLEQASISYIDTGAIDIVPLEALRQLRPDLLKFPIMAIECFLANVAPHRTELCYSFEAGDYFHQMTAGCVLRASVQCMRNGIPCVNLHRHDESNGEVRFLNKDLVESGYTRWIDA